MTIEPISTILNRTVQKYYKRQHVINILKITMISSKILVKGGVFNDCSNVHKVLKVLQKSKFIKFYKYPIPELNSFQHFYYLPKPQKPFHIIHKDTLFHDSITAIFLIHLYRACFAKKIFIQWYPPFPVGNNKFCDGGLTLSRDGKLLRSILIETDMGTHCHSKIIEKYQNYARFLQHSRRKILFLVPSDTRIQNLKKTLFPNLKKQVFFINPFTVKPNMDVFQYVSSS